MTDDVVQDELAKAGVELPTAVVLKAAKGDLRIQIVVPHSPGLRHQITYAVVKNEELAWCAALGICSAKIRHAVRYQHDLFAFGSAVLDWLLEQGVPYLELLEEAKVAWLHCSRGLVSTREVKETEVFTEPPQDPSTG